MTLSPYKKYDETKEISVILKLVHVILKLLTLCQLHRPKKERNEEKMCLKKKGKTKYLCQVDYVINAFFFPGKLF